MITAFALHPRATATSVRGDVMTDGPFIDTKEAVAGDWVIDAPDLDAALEIAAKNPATRLGGGIRGATGGRRLRPCARGGMSNPRQSGVEAALADAHRREWALVVLAATARVARGLDLAEECVQEAYAAALAAWTTEGIPKNPTGWITTTARRRASTPSVGSKSLGTSRRLMRCRTTGCG